MTRMTKSTAESNNSARLSLSGLPNKVLTFFKRKETYTYEEVFGGIKCEQLTLEESLRYLEISESEFQEQLHSRGFCQRENFDRNDVFPVEWVDALDTLKWIETD